MRNKLIISSVIFLIFFFFIFFFYETEEKVEEEKKSHEIAAFSQQELDIENNLEDNQFTSSQNTIRENKNIEVFVKEILYKDQFPFKEGDFGEIVYKYGHPIQINTDWIDNILDGDTFQIQLGGDVYTGKIQFYSETNHDFISETGEQIKDKTYSFGIEFYPGYENYGDIYIDYDNLTNKGIINMKLIGDTNYDIYIKDNGYGMYINSQTHHQIGYERGWRID